MGRVKNRVAFNDKPAAFAALAPQAIAAGDTARPFSLTVGPILHHNGTYTTWSENNLSVAGQCYVEINPADAAKAGIVNGASVRLSSALGSVALTAKLSDSLQTGALFVPAHFRDAQLNLLQKNAGGQVAVTVEKG
jgi:predicted molibdopterin-dependent oxidoreductase YjgC